MIGYNFSVQSSSYGGGYLPQPAAIKEEEIKELENIPNEKIFGYFLISKPANVKSMDPLIVGCVYYKMSQQKYYIKVVKLTWSLLFL
jgi:hypothetical protein